MRIGINTLAVNRSDFGGGERYLYFLLKYLAKIDKENEYFIFASEQNKDRFNINQANFRIILCPVNIKNRFKRILYEQFFLSKLLKQYKIDVFHAPNNVLPFRLPCKSVLTIQYMINFVMPHYYYPFYKRWYFNTLMRFTAKRANKIISVSYNLKNEIEKFLKVDKKNIVVIYHGVDTSFSPGYDKNILMESIQKRGINIPYLLCVANNVPNKNLRRLILAFHYLKEKYKIPHQLVIIGSLDLLKGEKEAILKESKNLIGEDITFTGYVDYNELPAFYSCADVFVLTSLCESFGIPIIEAMKCGVPVITSNISAMPEIIGNAGVKVNPYDIKEIAEGIYGILNDFNLRQDLVTKGLQRSKEFFWEQTAQKTLAVYKDVYGR